MSTNYYLKTGRHIGLSCRNRAFLLHVYPDEGIFDLEQWIPLFESDQVVDEYGREISAVDMQRWIENHDSQTRHRAGKNNCIESNNPEKNYDLFVGEFS